LSPELDYYTPIIIANEKQLRDNPGLVRRFLVATKDGYAYAAANPEKAAAHLRKSAPEISEALAVKSIQYLAPNFTSNERWGEMKKSVWQTFGDFMFNQGLLPRKLQPETAFTNDFLP
jgi:ABC-type nitrate/sulfonate/bicarbonate transport system substrate-binding protein